MNQSHISLRDDYAVSCEEIDILVDLAWQIEYDAFQAEAAEC